jgi:hypothetical protein
LGLTTSPPWMSRYVISGDGAGVPESRQKVVGWALKLPADDPVLVREHNELDAVPRADLHQDS